MRIGIIQASSQICRNEALLSCVRNAIKRNGRRDVVINYGVFPGEDETYSYIEIALEISMLLSSGAADFIVTGCSSGQGMMLACNSLPGVLCGYVQNPQDAFLFGRINGGNAASFPLGLNFGWLGEINMQCTMDKLFEGAFGCGYPPEEAARKRRDTELLKSVNSVTKNRLTEVLGQYDRDLVKKALRRETVLSDIRTHGTDKEVMVAIERFL